MRKEDEVEIPSLTLDDDELKEHSPSTASAAPKRRLTPAPAHPTTAHHSKRPSNRGVYFVLFLVIVMAAGASGWMWFENQKLTAALVTVQAQLNQINSQVSEVDASADERVTSVAQTLENHDSEIRKLWGVANDRNRTALAEQAKSLTALEQKMAQLRESLSTQSKLVAVQGDAFNEVENGYNRLVETVTAVESTQDAQAQTLSSMADSVDHVEAAQKDAAAYQRDQLGRVSKRLETLAGQVDSLSSRVRSLGMELETVASQPSNLPDNLSRRLQTTEEAIESIDQFRPQVLREINSLKAQVRQLSRD